MKSNIGLKNRYHFYTTKSPWSILFLISLVSVLYIFFNLWESYYYWPITGIANCFTDWSINTTFNNCSSVLSILGINYYEEIPTFYIKAADQTTGFMTIAPSCTPIRAWFYWIVLMLFLPGRKHKSWYIPLGLMLIYLVNIIRIALLGLVLTYNHTSYNAFHSLFETLVFATIFLLWVIWIEKFVGIHQPNTIKPSSNLISK